MSLQEWYNFEDSLWEMSQWELNKLCLELKYLFAVEGREDVQSMLWRVEDRLKSRGVY